MIARRISIRFENAGRGIISLSFQFTYSNLRQYFNRQECICPTSSSIDWNNFTRHRRTILVITSMKYIQSNLSSFRFLSLLSLSLLKRFVQSKGVDYIFTLLWWFPCRVWHSSQFFFLNRHIEVQRIEIERLCH